MQINEEYILIILETKKSYNLVKNIITKIIISRGIKILESKSKGKSLTKGFPFNEWKIIKNQNNAINLIYSESKVKLQKNKLKSLIKDSKNQKIFFLIKKLNTEIISWKENYYITSSKKKTPQILDLYLNKLIWGFIKKEHPRRPNTWIYNKYWKYLSGYWKFTAANPETGKINILHSHIMNYKQTKKTTFPYLLNSFTIENLRKILLINFALYKNSFSGISNIIYTKQKGLCYICKFPLKSYERKSLKIKTPIKKILSLRQIIYIHNYCEN